MGVLQDAPQLQTEHVGGKQKTRSKHTGVGVEQKDCSRYETGADGLVSGRDDVGGWQKPCQGTEKLWEASRGPVPLLFSHTFLLHCLVLLLASHSFHLLRQGFQLLYHIFCSKLVFCSTPTTSIFIYLVFYSAAKPSVST